MRGRMSINYLTMATKEHHGWDITMNLTEARMFISYLVKTTTSQNLQLVAVLQQN